MYLHDFNVILDVTFVAKKLKNMGGLLVCKIISAKFSKYST